MPGRRLLKLYTPLASVVVGMAIGAGQYSVAALGLAIVGGATYGAQRSRTSSAQRYAPPMSRLTLQVTVGGADASEEALQRLEQSEESLRIADRRKDVFLATLAHELRNPMAPIARKNPTTGSAALSRRRSRIQSEVRLDLEDRHRVDRSVAPSVRLPATSYSDSSSSLAL